MSFWDWVFGLGKRVPRKGPAHSSDRHGFWKDLWKLRKSLGIEPEHSGSVDIYDHFGCAPYNDNPTKRERRDNARWALYALSNKPEARQLLKAFDEADKAKGWKDTA